MIVLDTNVVSETLKPHPDEGVIQWLTTHGNDTTITAITVAEISVGIEILPEGKRKRDLRQWIGEVFDSYESRVLVLDNQSARIYGSLVARRRSQGNPLTTEDAMIAAICTVGGFPLATRNTKDFEGLDLTLINPWE
ncbi:MAG: type II toxin-antitoxin system VapC family toxin [Propionibacteriaceae bacterium]|nr:type II toxin-antitoxin system VapC family toxin [Propionibacteriaceae bacterium]